MTAKRSPKITTIEIIDIPPEHSGAMEVAWKRARQLSWGMPLWMLESMKPMLVSIYMQGCVDGFGACEKSHTAAESSATANESNAE